MKWIKIVAINVGIFIIFLFIIEGIFHLSQIKYKILPPLEPWGYSVADTTTGYDIVHNFPTTTSSFYDLSYQVSSNELGCFDYPYGGDTPYIYVTGDSFAWGWTALNDKWGKVIERETGIRTLTCGVNGYGTKQELLKTEKTISLIGKPPTTIIVGYLGANDVDDDAMFPNYTVQNGYRVHSWDVHPSNDFFLKTKEFFAINSVLFNILKNRIYPSILNVFKKASQVGAISEQPISVIETVAYKKHIENVLGFKILADAYKANLLFVLIPSKNDIAGDNAYLNENLKKHLDHNGIAYIDLYPDMKKAVREGRKVYWDFDGHWNTEGNRLAGDIIVQYLKQQRELLPERQHQ